MIDLKNIFKRRVKGQDKELEQFRQLLTVPDTFDQGFNITSLLGTLFIAVVMVPGAMYMGLVAGIGIGNAAQWVTVLLFVEVAKRANAKLTRAQLLILFTMSGMILGGSGLGSAIWNQFFIRSDAAISTGVAPLIPNWVAPSGLNDLPRTFIHKAWLPFIGLMLFREIMGRFDSAILGYGLFRLTSDIERLPFPMAPLGAQGILALSEQVEGSAKSAGSNVRWRMFCIGCGIGMVFGLGYMALPTITGAYFDTPLQIFKIPFADFTPYTQDFLPAVATGYNFDLGLVVTGMVLPFYSMVGSFIGLLFTFVMNPILFHRGMMPTWQQGDTTVTTLFANNVDFYFSFSIGVSLAIAFYGIYVCIKTVGRNRMANRNSNPAPTPATAGAHGPAGAADTVDFKEIDRISRLRGHVPSWLVGLCYFVAVGSYITMSGWLIGWHRGVMIVLVFFGFVYTPLISYVTARLEGMAGQAIEIPFIREIAFILSGYVGMKIWFLPIPASNYGYQVVSYKHAELLGCKFSSIWKSQFFLYPIIIVSTLLFSSFIWSLAEIPSAVYPFTMEMWDLNAKNACLMYTATLGEYSLFQEALGFGRFISGFASAGVLMGVLGWFAAPTMLFFGVVRGLGSISMPHIILPQFIGALIGRYYFERKYGREWRKMIPVVSAGFFVGAGLISILAVGLVFLAKAVSTVSY